MHSGPPEKPRDLARLFGELALFAGMLGVEARRSADGTTLPVLDSVERILCRALACLARLSTMPAPKNRRQLLAPLLLMLQQYETQAKALRERLEPVLDTDAGIALAKPGEAVDYPLRALRFCGYQAVAGLAHQLAGDANEAERYGSALHRLWATNPGACLSPVTDDQIIEMALVWELWLRCGHRDWVAQAAFACVERLALRRLMGLPLPSLYQRARVPMRDEDLRILVEAHAGGRTNAAAGFEDGASTILSLAVFLACRLGETRLDELLHLFQPNAGETESKLPARAVYAESWQPAPDSPPRWYSGELQWTGTSRVFTELGAIRPNATANEPSASKRMAEAFDGFHKPLPESPATRWGLPVVDYMAWKLWRTPPPMETFVRLLAAAH